MTLETPSNDRQKRRALNTASRPGVAETADIRSLRPVDPVVELGARPPGPVIAAGEDGARSIVPVRKPKQSGVLGNERRAVSRNLIQQAPPVTTRTSIMLKLAWTIGRARPRARLRPRRLDSWPKHPRTGSSPPSSSAVSTCLVSSRLQDFRGRIVELQDVEIVRSRARVRLSSVERLMAPWREIRRLRPVVVAGLGGDHGLVAGCRPPPCQSALRCALSRRRWTCRRR